MVFWQVAEHSKARRKHRLLKTDFVLSEEFDESDVYGGTEMLLALRKRTLRFCKNKVMVDHPLILHHLLPAVATFCCSKALSSASGLF